MASVWRRSVRRGELTLRRAGLALADLAALPVSRARHQRLVARCWELRDNLTIYDAAYVALAEALGVMLVTADRRMAGAARIKCKVDVLV